MLLLVSPLLSILRFARSCSGFSLVASVALLLLVSGPPPVEAESSAPFETRLHRLPGTIHQVWPLSVSRCAKAAGDLLVLHTRGTAPAQEKRITWMPCGSAVSPGDPRIVERVLPDETALVDVATMHGRQGPQLFLASARGLRIEALDGSLPPREISVPGGLPLPHRPWEISRLSLVDDWNDLGPPSALVPASNGSLLIDLESGAARLLEMPVFADYRTFMPDLPETEWNSMKQRVTWPSISRGDDNGDGRIDLFALSRYAIFIYHTGPSGLPARPSRRIMLTPFDEETEREHESSTTHYFARDIDGDARADLLLGTVGGGLADGRSTTKIYLNGGSGVDVSGKPAASRTLEGGASTFNFVDVDGDGRDEILETSLEFGVLQVVRFLLTRRLETTVRVFGLDANEPEGLRVLFEDDFGFKLDFDENNVRGLVPNLGDWNGDGVLDFYLRRNDDEIAFRMGSREPGKPRFGAATGALEVPLFGGHSRVADLNGDGLDEIIALDPRKPDQGLVVFENLGRLPGTRPTIQGANGDER